MQQHPFHGRGWLLAILAAYLLITLAYGIRNPLFEAPDEHWHYFTVEYIKQHHSLPAVGDPYDEWMAQEAAQPPLYYVLAALLISPIDNSDGRDQLWLNPFFYAGDAARLSDINQFVHTTAEQRPWQGMWLAAHLLRMAATVLGLGTLLCLYSVGRLLWPQQPRYALWATAVVAFLPQYNFAHASISNDPLIIFLASFVIWQLVYLWQYPVNWPRLLLLGISCGLATLTKNAGTLLLVYTTAVLFLQLISQPNPDKKQIARGIWQTAVFVLLPALLMSGWLWWRNYQLYHDITATEPFIRIAHGDRQYSLLQVLGETGGLLRSGVAVFGWFNLLAPSWVYAIWGSLGLAAFFGGLWQLAEQMVRHPRQQTLATYRPWLQVAWLAAWPLMVYAGLVLFMLRTPAAQGRLLFPAIIPLAYAAIAGLRRWPMPALFPTTAVAALLTTLYCVIAVIGPAYAHPEPVAQLPSEATPLQLPMGDGLWLHAVQADSPTAVAGDTVWFTFYWSVETPPTKAPELVVELFGRDLALVAKSHTYHGRGLYPAPLWPSQTLIADRVGVRLEATAVAPVLASVFVRLADQPTGVPVSQIKVMPSQWPTHQPPALARLGDVAEITAVAAPSTHVQPGDTVQVRIDWRVLNPTAVPLTTLLHLGEAGQPPLATGDAQPIAGHYPTHVWGSGEQFSDHYSLAIPADLPHGRYPLWVGLYDAHAPTFPRQPIWVNGQAQPHDVWQIGTVMVGE